MNNMQVAYNLQPATCNLQPATSTPNTIFQQ